MGGGQSLRIGLGHVDLFSAVASFSGAVPADFETRFAALLNNSKEANQKIKTLWIGCGQQDSLFARSKNLSELLTKYQVRHIFHATDGVHNYTVWRKYIWRNTRLCCSGPIGSGAVSRCRVSFPSFAQTSVSSSMIVLRTRH